MGLRLTVGMATYDDFDGVAFTVQALWRLQSRPPEEIVVVDNNPGGAHGPLVQRYLSGLPQARYVPMPELGGTSQPRNRVFAEASGDLVVCLDSHVLLDYGALEALEAFYARWPERALDLLSGPLIYDGPSTPATHFDDEWRAEMWGTWSAAWACPCGAGLSTCQPEPGQLGFKTLAVPMVRVQSCPGCGGPLPRVAWSGHEVELVRHGFVCLAFGAEPFEIPAQGLGLFACRKDAWLGFNERFRGFGGEEWYIHTKYRQAGRRCWSLPALKWWHRFGRPGGVTYPLTRWHKVRNYALGHQELGLDLAPVHAHFVASGLMPAAEWEDILAGRDWPQGAVVANGCGSCAAAQTAYQAPPLEEWYEQAWKTPSDVNEHCPTLREYAGRSESVVEFGVRRGVSTVALLAGQPKRLTSYDLNTSAEVGGLLQRAGATAFQFVQGDSRQVDIEECDLLFIDTKHTAEQLYAELSRHASQVRKWIILHDTEIYGERGDDGTAGLLVALRRYLREHPEWSVVRHDANNHGLTVVSRVSEEKPELPSTSRQVWNFGKALLRMAAEKVQGHDLLVSEEVAAARLDVCALCPHRNDGRCSICGCFLVERPDGGAGKAVLSTEDCPLAKWPAPVALPVVS